MFHFLEIRVAVVYTEHHWGLGLFLWPKLVSRVQLRMRQAQRQYQPGRQNPDREFQSAKPTGDTQILKLKWQNTARRTQVAEPRWQNPESPTPKAPVHAVPMLLTWIADRAGCPEAMSNARAVVVRLIS